MDADEEGRLILRSLQEVAAARADEAKNHLVKFAAVSERDEDCDWDSRSLECSRCYRSEAPVIFKSRRALIEHVLKVHYVIRIPCAGCGRVARSIATAYRHRRSCGQSPLHVEPTATDSGDPDQPAATP